jgi:very-short-patch-repair endonuclease
MKLPMHLPYNKNIYEAAKKLRRNLTNEEKKLWYQYLSCYPVRFIKQKIIDDCILDFYCAKCRLCIEVDGGQHYTEHGIAHDEARTKLLNLYGITVIRFTNERILTDFFTVCTEIDWKVKELLSRKKH